MNPFDPPRLSSDGEACVRGRQRCPRAGEGGIMRGATRKRQVVSRVLTIAATCAFIASAVAVLTPGAGASPIANGKISFNRIDVALDVGSAFTIDPDGSNEAKVQSDGDI